MWRLRTRWALLLCCSMIPAIGRAEDTGTTSHTPSRSGMSVVVLGSGGPGADGRAASGYLIEIDGRPRILIDAGPGTFVRIGEIGADLDQLDVVLLTHLHVDHAAELPGLIKARIVARHRDTAFRVFGPPGSQGGRGAARFPSTTKFMDLMFGKNGAFGYLGDFAGHLTLRSRNVPRSIEPQILLSNADFTVTAITGHHGDAPAVIFRIDSGDQSATFTGDIDSAGHAALERIAHRTQLLIFDAVVLDPPGSPPVLYTLHTTPADIGRIAHSVGATQLVLSHLNRAIDAGRQSVERSIRENFDGPLDFAHDGSLYSGNRLP